LLTENQKIMWSAKCDLIKKRVTNCESQV